MSPEYHGVSHNLSIESTDLNYDKPAESNNTDYEQTPSHRKKRHTCYTCMSKFSSLEDLEVHRYVHLDSTSEDDIFTEDYYEESLSNNKGKEQENPNKTNANIEDVQNETVDETARKIIATQEKKNREKVQAANTKDSNNERHTKDLNIIENSNNTNSIIENKILFEIHCIICKSIFRNIEEFNAHNARISCVYYCITCSKKMCTKKACFTHLVLHAESQISDELYKCTLCSFTCFTTHHLIMHKRKNHATKRISENRKSTSSEDIVDTTIKDDKNSLQIDAESSLYKCSECSFKFRTVKRVQKHFRKYHKNKTANKKNTKKAEEEEDEDNLTCDLCFDVFDNKEDLTIHQSFHKELETSYKGKSNEHKDDEIEIIEDRTNIHNISTTIQRTKSWTQKTKPKLTKPNSKNETKKVETMGQKKTVYILPETAKPKGLEVKRTGPFSFAVNCNDKIPATNSELVNAIPKLVTPTSETTVSSTGASNTNIIAQEPKEKSILQEVLSPKRCIHPKPAIKENGCKIKRCPQKQQKRSKVRKPTRIAPTSAPICTNIIAQEPKEESILQQMPSPMKYILPKPLSKPKPKPVRKSVPKPMFKLTDVYKLKQRAQNQRKKSKLPQSSISAHTSISAPIPVSVIQDTSTDSSAPEVANSFIKLGTYQHGKIVVTPSSTPVINISKPHPHFKTFNSFNLGSELVVISSNLCNTNITSSNPQQSIKSVEDPIVIDDSDEEDEKTNEKIESNFIAKCDSCHTMFYENEAVLRHSQDRLTCNDCREKFCLLGELEKHYLNRHEKIFCCTCRFLTKSLDEFKMHTSNGVCLTTIIIQA